MYRAIFLGGPSDGLVRDMERDAIFLHTVVHKGQTVAIIDPERHKTGNHVVDKYRQVLLDGVNVHTNVRFFEYSGTE